MKVTALVENNTTDKALKAKHGLGLYIETARHKVLFDLGPDGTLFQNAQRLGIDLAAVDTVVLSHGHKDHGGALAAFLQVNSRARIYVQRSAFEGYAIRVLFARVPIGLDAGLREHERLVFVDDVLRIDDELLVFADVVGQFDTRSNRKLLKKVGGGYERDDFLHEQGLIVQEGGTAALFSGCSHRGIANILRAAQGHVEEIGAVFGGFHLYDPPTNATEPKEVVEKLAQELVGTGARYYTGHCTGKPAYDRMRGIMGDSLRYFAVGAVAEL